MLTVEMERDSSEKTVAELRFWSVNLELEVGFDFGVVGFFGFWALGFFKGNGLFV